jgi:putative colanic acid biosynthesis acetyltransferase WcaF
MKSQVTLNKFDGKLNLHRGAGKLKESAWYAVKMLFFLTAFPYPSALKARLLRLFGAKVGRGLCIKPRVNIHFPWKLEIGDHVWIGEEVFLLNFEKLTIGNNVCISQRAFLCGGNHDYKSPAMPYRNGEITLQDGSWIGAGVFVAPQVTVGTDTVVTACSVALKSLPENAVCAGNPAKFIKERNIK